jgi:phage terminase large subunit-like protein
MSREDNKKILVHYAACDLAISKNEGADYSVFIVAGMDDSGKLFCKHVIRDRMDAHEIVETILMITKIYKPVMFGIEQNMIHKAIGPYLNEAMMPLLLLS